MATPVPALTASKYAAPSRFPLPLTLPSCTAAVTSLRDAVRAEHQKQRLAAMRLKFGPRVDEEESFARRSDEQREYDDSVMRQAHPLLADEDPFASTWLNGPSTLSRFPPHEVAGAHARTAKDVEAVMAEQAQQDPATYPPLVLFVEKNETLLCVTAEELDAISFMDSLLLRFALTRRFDVDSAATRFLNLRALMHDNQLSFALTPEMEEALALGTFQILPPTLSRLADLADGHPRPLPPSSLTRVAREDDRGETRHPRCTVSVTRSRYFNWTAVSVPQMKRAWFYFALLGSGADYYTPCCGLAFFALAKGATLRNMSLDFQRFIGTAVSGCLPSKLQRGFLVHQPALLRFAWTLMKRFLSEKTRRSMKILGEDATSAIVELGADRVPSEIGGLVELPEDGRALVDVVRRLAAAEAGRQANKPIA